MKPSPVHQAQQRSLRRFRGPIVDAGPADGDGQKIIKLNIGNMAPFGFDPPEEIGADGATCSESAGYLTAKGIFARARP